jgi:sec-independent protein translocase protein TatB
MFNIGPMELGVLVLVALIVLGPEKLPGLAREAAQMLRTLRDLATGARRQLKDELGPEFPDLDLSALNDLRSLNPRTAISRAIFSDDDEVPAERPAEPHPPTTPPRASRPLGRGERAPFDEDAT